jgi:hypothetical protein
VSGEEAMGRDAVGRGCGRAGLLSFGQDSKQKQLACGPMLSLTVVLEGRTEEAVDFGRSRKAHGCDSMRKESAVVTALNPWSYNKL